MYRQLVGLAPLVDNCNRPAMKLLLVEDSEELADIFKTILIAQRYTVDVASDGQLGLELGESQNYDLIILDVVLPKLDGISICRRLRSRGIQTPILMLTSRGTADDRVMGLDAGADDYLLKPPNLNEFVARVRALLRRNQISAVPVLEWGDLCLDPNKCAVTYGDYPLHFTPKEYAMLELFLRNPQRVYTRDALLDQLWSFDDELPGEATIRAHIKGMRQKLKAVGAADLIETVYGLGYRLNAVFAKKTPKTTVAPSAATVAAAQSADPPPPAIASQIWQHHQPAILQQLHHLLEVVQVLKLAQGQPSPASELTEREGADQLSQLASSSHKLIGTLGAFGLEQASQIMRQIEGLAKSHVPLSSQQVDDLSQLLLMVIGLLDQMTSPIAIAPVDGQTSSNSSGLRNTIQGQRLLLVDDDATLADLLTAEAKAYGLQVTVAASVDATHTTLRSGHFDAVVMDLVLAGDSTQGLSLLTYLVQQYPHLPVLVFTASESLAERMAVAQLKAKGFLQKPKAATEVLEAIASILQPSTALEIRILAVDDDRVHLKILQSLLKAWGFQITTLAEPAKFWETLESTNPDLLILDVQMPHINGIQLCQTLRNDVKWGWLPILFLTSSNDAETLCELFAAGADDYVNKPIMPPELLARLLNRLERIRLLRNRLEKDTLTDLPTRKRVTEELTQWIQLGTTQRQPFSVAMLRIDRLQAINQQYGYTVGDQVLRKVSKLLRQELRKEDVVARWGGAEFAVGMYEMTRQDGVEWLAGVLETLRSQPFITPDDQLLQVTFSAGVAQFPDDGNSLGGLQEQARKALTLVEQMGGDRVFATTWKPPILHPVPTVDMVIIHPDPTEATAIMQALTTRGFHCQIITDAKAAIDQLCGTKPTLRANTIMLADRLPGFNGIPVVQKLHSKKILRSSHLILLLYNPTETGYFKGLSNVDHIPMPCSIPSMMYFLNLLRHKRP